LEALKANVAKELGQHINTETVIPLLKLADQRNLRRFGVLSL